mmetsp:Transcript_78230/g.176794  ORF Transcript_78230/g.176794 Transcript_78230/m.176794 type:complete len:272 (+) Transcript_78230:99-914(+)
MFCCSAQQVGAQDEIRPLTSEEQKEKDEQDAKVASKYALFVATCCCLKVQDRDYSSEILVMREIGDAPSLYQRLCMCQWKPTARPPSGIEKIPQIRGLAGVTMQSGDHSTAGSLQTLKWGYWDSETRVFELPIFGGFEGGSTTGVWTEPITPLWCCLMNLGRTANYTYRFEFSPDFQHADIRIKGNPCVFCCVCCPCCPAWCTIPQWCTSTSMRQAEDSNSGSHWERFNGKCCRKQEYYYDLLEVIDHNGEPGPFANKLPLKSPKQFMISY